MNPALTLHRPAPLRVGLLLILSIAFLVASAVSLAPALVHSASAASSHAQVCKCAHCPGVATCCCSSKVGTCPIP